MTDYFHGPLKPFESERDGIRVTFYDRPIPLSRYTAALERSRTADRGAAGTGPDDAHVRDRPLAARLRRVPIYLHFRAVKP